VAQLHRPAVPVVDLLGEPVLDGGQRLVDQRLVALAQGLHMAGHKLGDGVGPHPLLKLLAVQPLAFQHGLEARPFLGGARAVVQVGRVAGVAHGPRAVDLHEVHFFGDRRVVIAGAEAVLHLLLQVEEGARPVAGVGVIDQDRALPEHALVALQDQVDHRVQQRVAGAEEVGVGLAGHVDQVLVEADALVLLQHRDGRLQRFGVAADRRRDARDLVAARLAVADHAAQLPECLHEKRADVVRLQAAGRRALHLAPDAQDVGGV